MPPLRFIFVLSFWCFTTTLAQQPAVGRLEGRVTLAENNRPIHNGTVMIVDLGLIAETDAEGYFVFPRVTAGTYDLIAYTETLSAGSQLVEVIAGQTIEANFQLRLSSLKQEITVTAKGRRERAFDAIQSVTSLDFLDLSEHVSPSVGETLEAQQGISKRSFGPGSARPVIRGFDGDRVLVMQDGMRVGSVASQSGDHGEPIDPASLERLEVVKGPATLLYGSNAIGGVVNAITGHHEIHQQPHEGLRGGISSAAGSNGTQLGSSINVEFGKGNWLVWGGGGGQRVGNYDSAVGEVENSKTRTTNGNAGFGWFSSGGFASVEYMINDGRYGIPFATSLIEKEAQEEEELENVDISFQRRNIRFGAGLQELHSFVSAFQFNLNYTDWEHDEVERFAGGIEEPSTSFDNEQFTFRGVFEQGRKGPSSGSFGFWGLRRDYDVAGEEALSPPVDQDGFALFALEEFDFERVKFQVGGRFEHISYSPQAPRVNSNEILPDRDFTGASGGVGARFKLWQGGAFVANFTSSFRAPALEELYNFGPHLGNVAFEIGNDNLGRERSNGLDLILRQESERFRGEFSFFYYDINDFVFLAPTGTIREGLIEADYLQGDSRFVGAELDLSLGLHENLWLNLGMESVDAELTELDQSVPRIPPLQGKVGLDLRFSGFSVKPEVVVASDQDELFPTEVRTPGYSLFNVKVSYTKAQGHFVHNFSVNTFNLGDRLYRNHLSFIKELAPEMGRGIRFSYAVKFF